MMESDPFESSPPALSDSQSEVVFSSKEQPLSFMEQSPDVASEDAGLVNETRKVEKIVDALVAQRGQSAQATMQQAGQIYKTSVVWVVGIVLLLIALSIAVGSWVTRRIARQLGGEPAYAKSVASRIANGDLKKLVIALVEADFKAELSVTQTEIVTKSLSPQRAADFLQNGEVPVVLTSVWRLHGKKGPHWVVVTGFDGTVFRILDPIAPLSQSDPGISVSIDEFRRITRYGRRRQTAALILSKGTP